MKCFLKKHIGSLLRAKEHHIINRQICDPSVCCDFARVGQDKGFFYMIIVIFYEGIQHAVDGVILAGFHFDGNGGQAFVIINQVIDLALIAVVVIVELETVRNKLACDNALIYRAQVNALLVV